MLRYLLQNETENDDEPLNTSQPIKKRKKSVINKHNRKIGEKHFQPTEDEALENFVFGDETEVLENLDIPEKPTIEGALKKAAWIDEDDETISTSDCLPRKKIKDRNKYAELLRENFETSIGKPKWANFDKETDSSDESDQEIVRTAGNLIRHTQNLTPGTIELRRCSDLNKNDRNSTIINSVKFHPSSQVALVADRSGKTTIFQVNGKSNDKIQSIQFQKFPISCADFSVDGEQIVVGSAQHSKFYYYDMMSGKIVTVPWEKGLGHCNKKKMYMSPDGRLIVAAGRFGEIHLISAKTKEWIGLLKMNGEVHSISFSGNNKFMFSHGEAGHVHLWDMDTRQCIHQFYDNGCINGTCIAQSPNDQYLATGSDSGVVNVYENPCGITTKEPKPLKTFLNLTTEITSLKFNHTSEILAMASNLKENSVKLAHFPSLTVYSNFPLQQQNISKITALDISINSGYFTAANNKGSALLYRIKKFGNY